ncbi:His-Xaa-Ser system radical SAM maturase HxsB [Chitinimonas viridis]|uniref:His-Xaa-Ser system radical SAM maturase HxsB n=1 Tax=Chitinimonas viridis TaxID=664880 RepID=A0ABT8B3I6_9NEIS|nr:His-Xaa-Ser system radical SAM maturase HxsB [Chitinimonas viridis]MDN3576693.1 His-Xaa-Ser system radical SAM maturase HxsB [Chitinimonas viridis]
MLTDAYPTTLYPFRFRRLAPDNIVAVSETGDHIFLNDSTLSDLVHRFANFSAPQIAELKSKFFLGPPGGTPGLRRLISSRIAAKHETVLSGPSLHIIVPTLQCAHSCRYCQVSRALDDEGHTMSMDDLDAACDTIFESRAQALTVEFQGGDPLLRFDLIRHAIERIQTRNIGEQRHLRFVVTSTLHQLTEEMCQFFKAHKVYLSTSIDGPEELHNRNRPLPGKDGYERTLKGMSLARRIIGVDAVAALVTVTRNSLEYAETIVDQYVDLKLHDIFLRPLSNYGFAVKNAHALSYSHAEFAAFYAQAFERVIYWNRQGYPLREVGASIALNKVLSTHDGGYVDLQSPSGAGLAAIVYNYDGFIYPSDEARMLAEMGDFGLRLGKIGQPLAQVLKSPVQRDLIQASLGRYVPGCDECAYRTYCGPDPVNTYGRFGTTRAPIYLTDHCQRQMWLFDYLFQKLHGEDEDFLNLAFEWAKPNGG